MNLGIYFMNFGEIYNSKQIAQDLN